MPTWALPWTDSFYRYTLLRKITEDLGSDDPDRLKDLFLCYLLDPEPLTTSVSWISPLDNREATSGTEHGNVNNNSTVLPSILHVGNSSINARIAAFYGTSGVCSSGIYCLPYEFSTYFNKASHPDRRGQPMKSLYNLLQWEIVNAVDTLYPLGEEYSLVLKPTGAANGGLEAVSVNIGPKEDLIEIYTDTCFKIYPSCLFYRTSNRVEDPQKKNEDGGIYSHDAASAVESAEENRQDDTSQPSTENEDGPYDEEGPMDIEGNREYKDYFEPFASEQQGQSDTVWNRTYTKYRFFSTRDGQLLEVKSSGNLFYARSINGIYVGRYTTTNDSWKLETVNNQHYESREPVYYMNPNPFIPAECAMLTNNTVMLYDATLGKERQCIPLSKLATISTSESDVVQSLTFGTNMNNLIMGGSMLYRMDLRSNKVEGLLYKTEKVVRVVSNLWAERVYNSGAIANNSLAWSYCGYYNYWKPSRPSFWGAFTAMTTHPVHRHIMACIYGASNSVLIWDLRLPVKPLLEIPLPSSEYLGARFRHLHWSMPYSDQGDSTLIAFSWRQKEPIACRFRLNRAITRFTKEKEDTSWKEVHGVMGPKQDRYRTKNRQRFKKAQRENRPTIWCQNDESLGSGTCMTTDAEERTIEGDKLFDRFVSGKAFEDDMELTVVSAKGVDIMAVCQEEVDDKVQSVGPLVESQEEYARMPFRATRDATLFRVFHGYCGISVIEKKQYRILCACSLSGSVFALDLELKRNLKVMPNTDEDEPQTNGMFEYTKVGGQIGLELPKEFITDQVRNVRVTLNSRKLKRQPNIIHVGVTEEFSRNQECFPLPLPSGEGTFDSKRILKWLMEKTNKGARNPGQPDIISLKDFEYNVGPREHLEELATNIWDCSSMKIDYEYKGTNVNNRFLEPTPPCSCFVEKTKDIQLEVLSSVLKALKVDAGTVAMEELQKQGELLEMSKKRWSAAEEYIEAAIKEGLEAEDVRCIAEDGNGVPAEGNPKTRDHLTKLMFHSPVIPDIKGQKQEGIGNTTVNDGEHKHYCGVGNLIAIKLKEHHTEQRSERIEKLLDTWKVSNEAEEGDVGQGIARFHQPPNHIELLRRTQAERDRLVRHLLSRTQE